MPVKRVILISFFVAVLLGCGKKKTPDPVETVSPNGSGIENTLFKCSTLPPPPNPFKWRDSTVDADKNINTFMFNPANLNEVVFVVNGDASGFNKMYSYHVPSKSIKYLASTSNFPPQLNNQGWIVYSNLENNIFKIKTNGDSLSQLTTGFTTQDPKWDYTQKNIYYFQSPYNNVPSQMIEIDMKGNVINSLLLDLPYTAVFRKSDKVIYLKIKENLVTLIQHDMKTQSERSLISGPYDPKSESVYFDNLTLDNTDENFYWSNNYGIFKCELASLRVDTLFKSCETVKFDNPVLQPVKPNEVLFSAHLIKSINTFQLLHEYKAIEYNTATKEMTELRIFP